MVSLGIQITWLKQLLLFVAAVVSACLTGCVAERAYRTDPQPQSFVAGATNAGHAMAETSSNYTLGVVEFDYRGGFYGTNRSVSCFQIDTVIDRIQEEAKTNGLWFS
jgi:hypothetical protein